MCACACACACACVCMCVILYTYLIRQFCETCNLAGCLCCVRPARYICKKSKRWPHACMQLLLQPIKPLLRYIRIGGLKVCSGRVWTESVACNCEQFTKNSLQYQFNKRIGSNAICNAVWCSYGDTWFHTNVFYSWSEETVQLSCLLVTLTEELCNSFSCKMSGVELRLKLRWCMSEMYCIAEWE